MTDSNPPIERLIELMDRLRDPDTGCPWDLKQSFRTIAPSTIEEAYEVVDAIERDDFDHLREELGDLLFQVVFYAQLAKEESLFDFDGIASAITDKLLRRHPHVFPDGTLESRVDPDKHLSETDVNRQWETIKQQERGEKGKSGVLDDVPPGLPASTRGVKLQKRASAVGFDWSDSAGVMEKCEEEWAELKQAIAEGKQEAIAGELGDVFFCLTNLARHLKLEPETVMRGANDKFVRRFEFIESRLGEQGTSLDQASLATMERLWQQSKHEESGEC